MNVRRFASVWRRVFLVAVLVCAGLAVFLFATTTSPLDRAHGGIAQDVAITLARGYADPKALSVATVSVQHDVVSRLPGGKNVHQWVWLVVFRGQWHLLCGGTEDFCNPTSEWVAIDYYTGGWI